jgi:hypothetical protein
MILAPAIDLNGFTLHSQGQIDPDPYLLYFLFPLDEQPLCLTRRNLLKFLAFRIAKKKRNQSIS